jgi:methyl-accepting chemotaxis protein
MVEGAIRVPRLRPRGRRAHHPERNPLDSTRTAAASSAATATPPRARRSAWWGDRSVATKVLVAAGIPALVAAAIGVAGMTAMSSTESQAHTLYYTDTAAVDIAGGIAQSIGQARLDTRGAILALTPDAVDAAIASYHAGITDVAGGIARYRALDGQPAAASHQLDVLETNLSKYRALQENVLFPLARKHDTQEWARQNSAQGGNIIPAFMKATSDLRSMAQHDAELQIAAIQSSARTQSLAAIVLIIVGLVLSVIVGSVVARGIRRASRRVLTVIDGLESGDLTRSSGLTTRDEMGHMGQALDRAVAELRGVMGTVVSGADAVAASSEELSATSTQISAAAEETSTQAGVVSAAAEQVSQNVASVASAAEQMASSIQEIASNASVAAEVAHRAVAAAASTSNTMAKLHESSAEIGNVVQLITSIAEQANRLALNATIEAARAGELGKGFAVVAGEVKELAQQTATATQGISRLVEGIQGDAGAAVAAIAEISEVVGQIADRQTTIASAVEQQTATTSEITRSVNEAATGAGEIAGTVTGVSTAAESTTEALGQSTVAIGELSRMAAALRGTVARFSF